jgi:hypothetical protein
MTKVALSVLGIALSLLVVSVGRVGAAIPALQAHEAILVRGDSSEGAWMVAARPRIELGTREICLRSSFQPPGGWGATVPREGATLCNVVEGEEHILTSNTAGEGGEERTLVAVAFASSVEKVRLWLGHGRFLIIPLKLRSPVGAASVSLPEFNVGAVEVKGPVCVRRFAAIGGSGENSVSPPTGPCPADVM